MKKAFLIYKCRMCGGEFTRQDHAEFKYLQGVTEDVVTHNCGFSVPSYGLADLLGWELRDCDEDEQPE